MKKQLFQHLSSIVESTSGVDEALVFDALSDREKLGCTALGSGVAIPHGKVSGLDQCQLIFCRLSQPVGFESGEPVQLVFCLMGCESSKNEPVKIISRISRLVADPAIRFELMNANSVDEVFNLITSERLQQAA